MDDTLTVTRSDPLPVKPGLEDEIRAAINRHSAENASDTPDYILAEYLTGCLNAFDQAVRLREKHYGRRDFV